MMIFSCFRMIMQTQRRMKIMNHLWIRINCNSVRGTNNLSSNQMSITFSLSTLINLRIAFLCLSKIIIQSHIKVQMRIIIIILKTVINQAILIIMKIMKILILIVVVNRVNHRSQIFGISMMILFLSNLMIIKIIKMK